MSNDTTKQLSLFDAIEIKLTKGYVTTVDIIDSDLAELKWHTMTTKHYASRNQPKGTRPSCIYMHRVILERKLGRPLIKGEEVDHVNDNPLDNRRENLRLATHTENNRNKKQIRKSGYKGVYPNLGSIPNPYCAKIMVNYKSIHLGVFPTAELAYQAYCEAAIKYHGDFAHV